ncbi:MAG: 16S rRNA (cytosine(1402)-N(4))-methyltransferase RsmH [Candidatus Cloacimonetes bacterium]|nr:16S rRNA (cytosine(1402)-N(4))-methyltransferase RsmH [Candidatus Cloacimonadota bacterium]
MSSYHTPVMAETCLDLLKLAKGKTYVDATLGGGGHALAMYKKEPAIKLYAFDQDADALDYAAEVLEDHSPVLIHRNFRHLRTELAYHKVKSIDGILFDLGVSSYQLDCAERGFSLDKDAELDMRMDRESELSAKKVVNSYSEYHLTRIFKEYGEEDAAKRIARAILAARARQEIHSTGELAKIIESVAGKGSKESLKTKVRIFQAIRIEVNDELNALRDVLTDAINLLNPGGRIAVMSYHSLEDRIVKNVFKEVATACICPPAIILCVCKHIKQLKIINTKPICASEEELAANPRSRSAKLRVAEKVKEKK